jgi:thiosulfate dehydrogenase [quinone] large subunit
MDRSVPAAALLPLRAFFGATFLYAGFDKLLDPGFLDPASPGSIQSQMLVFVRVSPLGALVQAGEPYAVAIGVLIAVAEIAIGLGALTGLAFRVAAVGGVVLSILFWLTASWTTHPYYFGPDLPYAAGWLVLAIAGHGDLLVPRAVTAAGDRGAASPGRRAFVQSGVLAVVALAAASIAVPLRVAGLGRRADEAPSAAPSDGGPSPSPSPGSSASAAPTTGIPVATVSDVARTGAFAFTVPFDAPAPLPAGDPGVIVRLTDGTFVAFDALCTHEGCTVEWERADRFLHCPCHGAVFDPADRAAVLEGPTDQPLPALPIAVDSASGRIVLTTH